MPKKKSPQKRLGTKEAAMVATAVKALRNYEVFKIHKTKKETFFNHLVLVHLLHKKLPVKNKNIHCASFVGETFRPECFVKGSSKYPLLAVECKKLTDHSAKSRWKEGLSQCLLYSHEFKAVILLLYDFTKSGAYYSALSSKKRLEYKFAQRLWKTQHIKIIALKPHA